MEKSMPYTTDYVIKNIAIMKYSPQDRKKRINKRALSSFMYVAQGKYHYKSDTVDFYVESGDTLYIPRGASYEYTILSDVTECIQTEFNLEQTICGEKSMSVIAKDPFVLKKQDGRLDLVFGELNRCQNDEFSTLASLYKLLAVFENSCRRNKAAGDGRYKIEPAIEFIKQNFKKKIYTADIAEMCRISESHMRRLFRRYLGVSPIEYKNLMLVKAACSMLQFGNLNVSETAEALNFGDIYTFSQFFKKAIGISPKHYIDSHREHDMNR